uniref:Uncharacterized protein n=1 Tax=Moniliophthora roreri TaxID=221103 RepID=A0A0W0F2G6_MONRR
MSGLPRLNADILPQIFHLCVAPQGGTFLLKEAPWTFGQSSVTVKESDVKNIPRAGAVPPETLRRTGNSKLHLYISADGGYGAKGLDVQPLVGDHCEDWEALALILQGPFQTRIIPSPNPQLSSLRRIHIEVNIAETPTPRTDEETLDRLIQGVQRTPLIDYVCLQGNAFVDKLRTDLKGAWRTSEHSNFLERLVLGWPKNAILSAGDIVHLPRSKISNCNTYRGGGRDYLFQVCSRS